MRGSFVIALLTSFVAVAFLGGSVDCRAGEANCFTPFLTDDPPKIVQTISETVEEGVEVTRLKFLSRVVAESDREVVIYAVMARPTTPGPHPGLLVCHGGGGYADMVAPAVIGWAKRGFVAVCQDQPGVCNVPKARSTGPCLEPGAGPFTIDRNPSDSALFDGVAAALGGLALLRSQRDVDKSRVGVFGGSWGGYMTTMVAGLAGPRVHAAFSIYGCGYFDEGSAWGHTLDALGPEARRIWLDNLDAGRRAKNLSAAYFVPSPANDWYFWPSAVMRTLADMPGTKNYCFMPNDSHSLRQPGGMSGPPKVDHRYNRTYMEIAWLEHHLLGKGKPFPRAADAGGAKPEAGAVRVHFNVEAPEPITKATVWYAAGELPWRLKWWAPVSAEPVDGKPDRYTAVVPVDEPGQPLQWFGLVTDRRNVSVSTLVRSLNPVSLGLRTEGHPAAVFEQDFEDRTEQLRWRRKYADRSPGRHRICPEAARGGEYGLELRGQATFACHGLRAATLRRSGVTKIRLWMRAAEKPCPMPAIELLAELPDSRRYQWRWANPAGEPLGPEWQAMDVALSDFELIGPEPAPDEMLSSALGQLRFVTEPETHVYVDDVEGM
ncbi:MAG: dienelactone hydrolase family protein [Planctomycetes bacterium]|nr:dienelactone hydrolase family protein [Planctomycetota bacterium]